MWAWQIAAKKSYLFNQNSRGVTVLKKSTAMWADRHN